MTLDKFMAILDPTHDQQPAYDRAVESCHLTGARLHIYGCLGTTQQAETSPAATTRAKALLERCVERARQDGIEATGELEWAADWRKQAVAAAARCCASMIFKTYTPHTDLERQIRTTYDWTLLRLAPCPVLLIKNRKDWKHRRVLAAIYQEATDETHVKLNNQIVSFALRFSDAYGSEAHIVTAYRDRNHIPDIDTMAEADFVHVSQGTAADVIRQTAEEIGADLVLIGTVGRDGIHGKIIGNTSERLLDHTPSDVLVIN